MILKLCGSAPVPPHLSHSWLPHFQERPAAARLTDSITASLRAAVDIKRATAATAARVAAAAGLLLLLRLCCSILLLLLLTQVRMLLMLQLAGAAAAVAGGHECFEVCFAEPDSHAVDAVGLVVTATAKCILQLCFGQMTVGVAVAASSSIVRVYSSCLVCCLVLYGFLCGWAVAVLMTESPGRGRPVGTAAQPMWDAAKPALLVACMVIMIKNFLILYCYKRHCSCACALGRHAQHQHTLGSCQCPVLLLRPP